MGLRDLLLFDLLFFIGATLPVGLYYIIAQKEVNEPYLRKIICLPFLMAFGIGLCVNNGKAVLEALIGHKTPFLRTPKFQIETAKDTWRHKKYRGYARTITTVVELALAVNFVFAILFALQFDVYASIPFLLLFCGGFFYVSLLSFLPYFEKAKWLDVLPEYDPYKYNSFPVNAANQIYGLTQRLQAALRSAGERGRLADLPPVLAFQSLVDATVAAADLVDRVFEELPAGGHELVVFDINRHALLQSLIAEGPRKAFDREVEVPALSFDLTVVANRSAESADVAAWQRPAGGTDTTPIELGLRWPRDVVSLSHVAVPFPPDDPVYGLAPRESGEVRFTLGETAMRGEAGVTVVPLGSLARLRSNPFFAVVRSKLEAAIAKDTGG
jgi:hypothetical protein